VATDKHSERRPREDERPVSADAFVVNIANVCWVLAAWNLGLGVFLLAAPEWFYGPSWRYFPYIPHNGTYMGVVCVTLGLLQCWALSRPSHHYSALAALFFLSGFVYWTAGCILGAEGLMGRMGLMEAPFALFVGAGQIVHSAALNTKARQKKYLAERGRHRHRRQA
jgi:hypothetical protein